jgi:hypothetical protein
MWLFASKLRIRGPDPCVGSANRALAMLAMSHIAYRVPLENRESHSVGVCQIVRPVGALRQNPSNAARQIQARVRAHYIPSNAHTL